MKNSTAMRRAGAWSLTACLLAAPAFAQDVRIIAKDGSLDITGTLISSENRLLTVRAEIGEISLDQSKVTCEGAACPQPILLNYAFNLAGPDHMAEVLIPILFDGFANDRDTEVVLLDETGYPIAENDFALAVRAGTKIPVRMIDYDGEEVANFGILEAVGPEAFDLLATGEVALVFSQEPATPEDIKKIAQAGAGNLESFEQEHVVAVEGLTVITHPDNAVPTISVQNVAGIFSGRINNWSQVGGANAPINLVSFAAGSDANRDTEALLLEPLGLVQTSGATIVASIRDMTAAVTADPNAIALVSLHNKRNARSVPLTNECGMVIPASPFTIKTEEYPLDKRIVAYSRNDTAGLAREFLDQLDSSSLDGLVSKAGFVDLSVVTEGSAYAEGRIAAAQAAPGGTVELAAASSMIAEMESTNRLSTTFRFAPRSSVLDNRARRDLNRIVDYIRREKPQTVYIVGFADSGGSFSQNQRLSESRARQVADQVAATATGDELAGTTIEVRGYGELSPVACNENFEGRAINRRVEVWAR